ncbi:uncharacterized protein PADG_12435 [Paracoccidioides brasiliensis Pb18]|uniref:Nucleoside phosphorylase domain-containing protein n=1 Tax=Paracoccidioides brasiliensis (strain Pb18) TaxID=502780 RepID=A0A0A0HVL7_PARBD|nr:uncharacterized protein PADG_12435 [Paracoccidioides brasiliensis Pb18]KGM91480.1 hypothetical protein PADG_12435 [Paracoccidioides brasiliensis Pb18]
MKMLSSLPGVKLGLMVGIGGVIPSQKNDIRLGDIVVGTLNSENHSDQENFDNCNEGNEEILLERPDEEPCIHYGGIVSGNSVIRNTVMRDLLAQSCLCFEMKTAGLMNYSPCLVIWGIWDLCDMHKNDR